MLRALAFTLIALLVLVLPTSAHAKRSDARLVFYFEVTGEDASAARERFRSIVPSDVLLVDSDEYHAALAAEGQTTDIGASFGVAAERPALFQRLRRAGRRVHADGVVVVLLFESTRLRVARVIGLFGGDEAPTINRVITLDPVKSDTDAAKLNEVLGPTLEQFAHPPKTQSAESVWQVAAPAPEIRSLRPREPPGVVLGDETGEGTVERAAEAETPRAAASLRTFPLGGAPSFLHISSTIPIVHSVAVVPLLGAGMLPRPVNDQAYIVGAGVRFQLGRRFSLEPSAQHYRFPKTVTSYQGQLTLRSAFGEGPGGGDAVTVALSTSVNRMLWEKGRGPRESELWLSNTQAVVAVRPLRRLTVTPSGGIFVFDRSLRGSTSAVNAVAYTMAPFPVQAFFGASVGYQLGRWMPYVMARRWIYAADTGTGVSFSPVAARMTSGADFVDASLGLFVSDSHGPLRSRTADVLPIANVDVGWTF